MGVLEGWKRAPGHPTNTQPFNPCAPFKFPADGTITISPGNLITIAAGTLFTPLCSMGQTDADGGGVTSVADRKDPFHASITPQAYATGAATVVAWMLVIMLIITPRTFFVGGTSGKSGLMGRRGMISGAKGGGSIIGVGTRPWLQKVAALTVAVSLTLATADTFKIAERQYGAGYMDALKLRDEVVSGMEIKVSRVISDIFLWLAQVQTLIRLFPRHKEKVLIKWIGFALILFDITFTSLNSFGPYNNQRRPRHFETAIPALSYLFQLSLSMLYAAWVMYYAITKRRYAFYHSMMWNIAIVALLSIVAILTPVVFFITDISNYTIAGWGDYFRWVGAAAASVIVWEWVERIEALEREERKDGILGREIYDGDEMLDTTPSHEVNWPGSNRQSHTSDDSKRSGQGGNQGGGVFTSSSASRGLSNLAHRFAGTRFRQPKTEAHTKRTIHIPAPAPAHRRSGSAQRNDRPSRAYVPIQDPPAVVASPVSRTDTTSADSTVYTVRYHPISDSPAPIRQPITFEERLRRTFSHSNPVPKATDPEKAIDVTEDSNSAQNQTRWYWQAITNPFRRKGRSPPPEVRRGRVIEPLVVDDVAANIPPRNYAGLALKDRLGTFAAQQGEKFRAKKDAGQQPELNLPVTIIPAQPRGKTWSPDILEQQKQSDESSNMAGVSAPTDQSWVRSDGPDIESSNANLSGSTDSRDVTQASSSLPSTRNSRIRFAPETYQRSGVSQQAEADDAASSQHPVALGEEVQKPLPAREHTPATLHKPSTNSPDTTFQNHIPTNHDR
ncbi:PalH/RIM21-domain-containing protein [Massariosphaeria phaeospora]|uniref:PalH/RIM21-domain-containing protein n=1 Tax=Massariosphaeria phaeospora TaxID=100035 RepID=A0A7C8MSE2_9PLEO|nr:PalH/RIM21-domain-containing protein [Massariosphaeria phaeospora]